MDKRKNNGIRLVPTNVLQSIQEVILMSSSETDLFNNVYKEIGDAVGVDVAIEMYHIFKGQQITFPVRLFNPSCIRKLIIEEYDGTNTAQLAKKYSYSEKTVRRIIKNRLEEK